MALRVAERLGRDSSQRVPFALLSLLALLMAALLTWALPLGENPYFGAIEPLPFVALATGLGLLLWGPLHARGGLVVYEPGALRRGWVVAIVLPTVLVGLTILVDALVVLPADLNVPLPTALLFYPVAAFVIGVLFHLLPLAVALIARDALLPTVERSTLLWGTFILVACFEPVLQLQFGFAEGLPSWALGLIIATIYAVNLTQLLTLWRYDLVTMLAVRLVYYLHWHLLWGTLRLEVLF